MVLQLKKYSETIIPDALEKILFKYKYTFNPSYIEHGALKYFAIRVYDKPSDSILALLFIWDNEAAITSINISAYFKSNANLSKVSDPKLFILNNSVWGTFNNGHTEGKHNVLAIFCIENLKIKQYFFCKYKNRNKIEKNWSFYTKDNNIFALYSLTPLTVLKLTHFENHFAYFEDYYLDKAINLKNYSIGTQLTKFKKNYLFIGHKKIVKKGKRRYFGKIFLFCIDDEIKVKAGNKLLIHSFISLFGNKKKFNKNLISCTYFSGIHVIKSSAYLGYGINDVSWNTVTVKLKKLWG